MTKIWAHRGASGDAPENTLAAFELAIQQGADGIELDVQLSADGDVVVMHDETVDRTTNGHGAVKNLSTHELRALDAGDGEPVPLLSEVLELLAPSGLMLNVELKNSVEPYPGLEEKVLELLHAHRFEHRHVISSFNHLSIRTVVNLSSSPTGLLYGEPLYDPATYAKHVGAAAIHPSGLAVRMDPGCLQSCFASGIKVNVWTINSDDDLREALALNLNAIITNYPARALELRG